MANVSKRLATDEGLQKIVDALNNTEAVQQAKAEIQAEGATQVANVQAAAEDIAGKVEQIQQNTDDVTQLRGDLSNYLDITFVSNTFINKEDGVQKEIGSYASTDFIEICSRIPLVVNTIMSDDNSALAYYDKDKNFISGINLYSTKIVETELEPPVNAKFIRYSFLTSKGHQVSQSYLKYVKLTKTVGGLSEEIKEVNALTSSNTERIVSIEELSIHSEKSNAEINKIQGNYIVPRPDGSCNISRYISGYFYTELYELQKGDSIKITSKDPSGSNVARVSKWVQGATYGVVLNLATKETSTFEYTATEHVEYLRFSGYNTEPMEIIKSVVVTPTIVKNAISKKASEIIASERKYNHWSYNLWKVLCIGDSLTSGASYAEEWGEMASAGASIDQNYPRILGRLINGEVTNAGFSGYSASTWYNNKISAYDFSQYDTFIIWLGTNNGLTDTLDTDVNQYTDYNDFAETETGYYCKIIEKIKADNQSCLIVLTKIFASKGDYVVTNTVIDKIAEKYGLPVIDNSDLGHNARPDLHANVANPHFGKAGNIFIANRYVEELGKWFEQDHLRSEYGYSARTN